MGDDQHARAGDIARGLEHLEDLRLHRDVQRGGRLVADQQVGIVGDRDRDHHALALTAGQLMGERPRPALRLGDADQFEQFDGAGPGGLPTDVAVVYLERLGDLVADGVDRRQRRHRILEHGADGLAAYPRHPLVGQSEQFVAVQPDRAGHLGVLGQQPDDGHRTGGLPCAGFADQRHDFARVDVKVHAAHRIDPLGVGRKCDTQVRHLEQAHSRRLRRSARLPGSSASRKPSPTRLEHITISTSTPAGNRNTHGNVVADFVPSAISVPSDTSGG